MGSLSGRGLGVRRSVVVGPQSPHTDTAVVGGREDVVVVGGDGVDGAVVSLHLSDQVAGLGGPELDDAGAAARHHDAAVRKESQPANPVFMRVI